MKIFYGIDGTGNYDKSAKPIACRLPSAIAETKQSHVKRVEHFGFARSQYVKGTFDLLTGNSSGGKVMEGARWIQQTFASCRAAQHTMSRPGLSAPSDPKIYLSGFSRGGASILCIAHELRKFGIPIECMYIFDAVDRSNSMNNAHTRVVPGNVKQAYHALRCPSAGSRMTFGNCGLEGTNNNLLKQYFRTTHGGVGGWENGESRVKPGFGREDLALAAAPFGILGRAVSGMVIERQGNIHEDFEPLPTNIGPAQEMAGMNEAWNWMSGNISASLRG